MNEDWKQLDHDAIQVPRSLPPPLICTGWRAAAALANAFTPNNYAPSVVGTRYVLTGT
jgi:hypothetical protein